MEMNYFHSLKFVYLGQCCFWHMVKIKRVRTVAEKKKGPVTAEPKQALFGRKL